MAAWAVVAGVAAAAIGTGGLAAWLRWKARDKGVPDRAVPLREYPATVPPGGTPHAWRVAKAGDRFQIVDATGRVVVLRGVNVGQGSKNPPWRAIARDDVGAFDQLRSWGVNAIRLVLPWEALEPRPQELDAEVVSYARWFVDQADRHGMVVIVDNHHNEVSRCFGGTGAPPWAHRPGVVTEEALARDCRYMGWSGILDLPRQLRWWADFLDASWTPDGMALQDHVIASFAGLASALRGHPGLLGYGPFNEPHCYLGDIGRWLHPGERGCEEALSGFYRQFARAVRAADPGALVFIEPPLRMLEEDPDGSGTGIERPDVDGVAWSVHWYDGEELDATCDCTWDRAGCRLAEFLDASRQLAADRFGTVRVLTEFGVHGCKRGAAEDLAHEMLDIEDAMASSFVWNYFKTGETWGMTGPREGGEDMSLVVPEIYAADPADVGKPRCHAGAFVRPYPQRIAGVPVSWGWDHSYPEWRGEPDRHHDGRPVGNTDAFTLVFRQGDATGDTWVYVPRALVFGEDPATGAPGPVVEVSDGDWRWSSWDANVLVWTTRPDRPEHRLEVRPPGRGRATGNGVGPCVPAAG
jgi:endoglycosylceramidase